MNKSASITKLAEALWKAQAEMPVVKMNATNPFLKSRFADLGAVIDASRPTLAKHGLSLSQFPTSDGDKIGVTNVLMHVSGEWIEDAVLLSVADEKGKSAAQVAGSVITYLRRYSWASMLGLYADEDTDGHAANGKKEEKKPAADIITAEKWDAWVKLIGRAKVAGVPFTEIDRSKTNMAELRETYNELLTHVKNAEAQAKAGN
jgi:hypothetical protein